MPLQLLVHLESEIPGFISVKPISASVGYEFIGTSSNNVADEVNRVGKDAGLLDAYGTRISQMDVDRQRIWTLVYLRRYLTVDLQQIVPKNSQPPSGTVDLYLRDRLAWHDNVRWIEPYLY